MAEESFAGDGRASHVTKGQSPCRADSDGVARDHAEPGYTMDGKPSTPRTARKRQPDTPQVTQKRERERSVLLQMIGIYCRGNHGTRRGELCPECAGLASYAEARVARCPRMETKTFCSQCPTHCYAAKQREAIRNVMRYSGPRILLHHPVLTIKHGVDTLRARAAE